MYATDRQQMPEEIIVIMPDSEARPAINKRERDQVEIANFGNFKRNYFGRDECQFHEKECTICCDNFKAESEIIFLKCSDLHFFHRSCIEEWVKRAPTCPLCVAAVKKD